MKTESGSSISQQAAIEQAKLIADELKQRSSPSGEVNSSYIPKQSRSVDVPEKRLSSRSVKLSIPKVLTQTEVKPIDQLKRVLAKDGEFAKACVVEAEYNSLKNTDKVLKSLLNQVDWSKSDKKLRKSYQEVLKPLLKNNSNLKVKFTHPAFGEISLVPLSKKLKKGSDLKAMLAGAKALSQNMLEQQSPKMKGIQRIKQGELLKIKKLKAALDHGGQKALLSLYTSVSKPRVQYNIYEELPVASKEKAPVAVDRKNMPLPPIPTEQKLEPQQEPLYFELESEPIYENLDAVVDRRTMLHVAADHVTQQDEVPEQGSENLYDDVARSDEAAADMYTKVIPRDQRPLKNDSIYEDLKKVYQQHDLSDLADDERMYEDPDVLDFEIVSMEDVPIYQDPDELTDMHKKPEAKPKFYRSKPEKENKENPDPLESVIILGGTNADDEPIDQNINAEKVNEENPDPLESVIISDGTKADDEPIYQNINAEKVKEENPDPLESVIMPDSTKADDEPIYQNINAEKVKEENPDPLESVIMPDITKADDEPIYQNISKVVPDKKPDSPDEKDS